MALLAEFSRNREELTRTEHAILVLVKLIKLRIALCLEVLASHEHLQLHWHVRTQTCPSNVLLHCSLIILHDVQQLIDTHLTLSQFLLNLLHLKPFHEMHKFHKVKELSSSQVPA